jgi:hypothetical protein
VIFRVEGINMNDPEFATSKINFSLTISHWQFRVKLVKLLPNREVPKLLRGLWPFVVTFHTLRKSTFDAMWIDVSL